MKDVTSISNDLVIFDSIAPKAQNVLQVQLGDLEYEPNFGVDLKFFINPEFQFQNESFKAYLIQRLAEHNVNVTDVLEMFSNFILKFTFYVGDAEKNSSGGFIK